MAKGVQAIQVRKQRGKFVVQAIGRTGRGVKFIVAEEDIAATQVRSPEFKKDVAAAVAKLLGSEA